MIAWIWNNINWLLGLFILLVIQLLVFFSFGDYGYANSSSPYLLLYYFLAWWVYSSFENGRVILFNFVFPIFLAFNVLVLGTLGFYWLSPAQDFINSFYKAANLITLNNSDFTELRKINLQLKIARSLGIFLAAYAFIVAFITVLGPENLGRLRFFIFRNIPFINNEFSVVIGDSEFIVPLVSSLLAQRKKILVLCADDSLDLSRIMYERFCWIIYGSPFSSLALQKSYFFMSKEVFLVNIKDADTFRAVLEMENLYNDLQKINNTDLISNQYGDSNLPFWYLNMESKSLKESLVALLESTHSELRNKIVYPFSVYQIAAQNLLVHPDFIPHIIQNQTVINCIHFNLFTQSYLDNVLVVYTYHEGFSIQINILDDVSKKDEIEHWIESKTKYSHLTGIFGSSYERDKSAYKGSKVFLNFQEMNFENFRIERNYNFESSYNDKKCSTIKFFIFGENNIINYKLVSDILPALDLYFKEHFSNISVGYRMEISDADEVKIIESSLNRISKEIKVHLFGNRFDLFKDNNLKNWSWLEGAMLLAYLYKENPSTGKPLNYSSRDIEASKKHWSTLNQSIKESNLYCFLHGYIKLMYKEAQNDLTMDFQKNIEHRRWLKQYLLNGWSPLNNKKEHEEWMEKEELFRLLKMHPMIIEYDKLEIDVQEKDTHIINIIFLLESFYNPLTSAS